MESIESGGTSLGLDGGLRRGGDRGLVRGLEHIVGCSVLINNPGCQKPFHWDSVRWPSICHSHNGILDLRVKTPVELNHDGLRIGVACLHNQVQEFVEVGVDRVAPLEICHRLQLVYGCRVHVSQTELPLEFLTKVFPVKELVPSLICLLPFKDLSSPLGSSS